MFTPISGYALVKADVGRRIMATPTSDSTSKATAAAKAKSPPIADVRRVRITPGGVLTVVLRCPPRHPRACGVLGTVVAGRALGRVIPQTPLTFKLRAASLPRGRSVARSFKLTVAQRAALKPLSMVNFRVRLAAPAKPKRVSEVFVRTRVPAQLRTG